jgi:hypothetical protein
LSAAFNPNDPKEHAGYLWLSVQRRHSFFERTSARAEVSRYCQALGLDPNIAYELFENDDQNYWNNIASAGNVLIEGAFGSTHSLGELPQSRSERRAHKYLDKNIPYLDNLGVPRSDVINFWNLGLLKQSLIAQKIGLVGIGIQLSLANSMTRNVPIGKPGSYEERVTDGVLQFVHNVSKSMLPQFASARDIAKNRKFSSHLPFELSPRITDWFYAQLVEHGVPNFTKWNLPHADMNTAIKLKLKSGEI